MKRANYNKRPLYTSISSRLLHFNKLLTADSTGSTGRICDILNWASTTVSFSSLQNGTALEMKSNILMLKKTSKYKNRWQAYCLNLIKNEYSKKIKCFFGTLFWILFIACLQGFKNLHINKMLCYFFNICYVLFLNTGNPRSQNDILHWTDQNYNFFLINKFHDS